MFSFCLIQDDPYTATATDIIDMFLTTLVYVNARRTWNRIPDM